MKLEIHFKGVNNSHRVCRFRHSPAGGAVCRELRPESTATGVDWQLHYDGGILHERDGCQGKETTVWDLLYSETLSDSIAKDNIKKGNLQNGNLLLKTLFQLTPAQCTSSRWGYTMYTELRLSISICRILYRIPP